MKIAILTRSASSISYLIQQVNQNFEEEITGLIIEYPKPIKLKSKRYKFWDKLNINIYRLIRRFFFKSKKGNEINHCIKQIQNLDGERVNQLLIENDIDFLFLKNAPILTKKFLNHIEKPIINAHSGLLPFYKGASCGFWPVVENNDKLGVTLHYVTEKLDKGEIVCQTQIPLKKVAYSYNYPAKINDLQIEAIAHCMTRYLKSSKNIAELSLKIKNSKKKYYPLPTFTAYLKGLKNLKKR